MSDLIVHVTAETFDEKVIGEDLPVLVDFWAPWCGPCKMIAPILEELATKYRGKLKICKLDVDGNREISEKFGIRGIPTLIIFKNGTAAGQKVGALSKSQLSAFIDSHL